MGVGAAERMGQAWSEREYIDGGSCNDRRGLAAEAEVGRTRALEVRDGEEAEQR